MLRGRKTDDLPHRLTLPFTLEEGRVPGMLSWLLYLASVFVIACVAWGTITEIRELAVAPGQVEPAGSVQLVQHLEGGIVSEILVAEGEIVEPGTVIVRLQPTAANSDLAQLDARAAALELQIERQSAALEGRIPDFDDTGKVYPDLARDQLQTFRSERENLTQTKDGLIARVEQRFSEVQTLHAEAESLERQIAIDLEQLQIRKKLKAQGFASRAIVLKAKRAWENTNADLISVRGRLDSTQEGLNEARIKLLEADAGFNNRMTEERTRASAELVELRQSLAKHRDRVARLLVRAPVKGVVQELVPAALGQVLQPGEMVARIVPMGQELVAQVRLEPKDIGHVKVGDPADIKISTFDPARFGSIPGTVEKISASTFRNEDGDPYFKAVISLENAYVGLGAQRHAVSPGMVVSAEIITGSKSLTRYLLKPVYRSLDIAFSER